MTTINALTAVDVISDGDQFAIFSTANGDTRKASASTVKSFMTAGNASPMVTQYASPTASGFSVSVTGTADVWFVLSPSAGYAAGTIVLPSNPIDRQLVTVSCSQLVSALTVSGTYPVRGAPTALTANGFFSLRFDDPTNVWVRVG